MYVIQCFKNLIFETRIKSMKPAKFIVFENFKLYDILHTSLKFSICTCSTVVNLITSCNYNII